ncbi:MAG: ATP-binding cassette domain-containing protein [Bdellovibrionales bacterium]|nr:ATP-binding cassette domain-containing protein [Bdellovibrionales bacterium]
MEAERVVLAVAAAKVSFAYDEKTIFRDFSLQIPEGSRVAIVGPSGCGKSTFLAMLGGHLAPTAGEIVVRGRPRTVHQRDGIFPWYTVRENLAIAMGAEIHDGARSRSDRLVEEADAVGASRLFAALSGSSVGRYAARGRDGLRTFGAIFVTFTRRAVCRFGCVEPSRAAA